MKSYYFLSIIREKKVSITTNSCAATILVSDVSCLLVCFSGIICPKLKFLLFTTHSDFIGGADDIFHIIIVGERGKEF